MLDHRLTNDAVLGDGHDENPAVFAGSGFRVGPYGRFEWTPPEFLLQEMAYAGVDMAVLQNGCLSGRLNEEFAAACASPSTLLLRAEVDEARADSDAAAARAAARHAPPLPGPALRSVRSEGQSSLANGGSRPSRPRLCRTERAKKGRSRYCARCGRHAPRVRSTQNSANDTEAPVLSGKAAFWGLDHMRKRRQSLPTLPPTVGTLTPGRDGI